MPNLKLAIRTLSRSPFVTAIAVGSLALGIGANTAIFSMFRRLLLEPLPVPAPEQLVNLVAAGPKPGSQSCGGAGGCDEVLSYPMLRDLQQGQTALVGLAGHRFFPANLAFRGQTLDSGGLLVTGSYFPLLGIQPALGRLLGPNDDQAIGGHFVTVLSYRYWETRLGADPDVVGQTLVVNGRSMTVVGVAPRGFDGTTLGERPRVFVPMTMQNEIIPGFGSLESRRYYWIYAFGRLAPEGTIEAAQAALNAVYRPIINDVEAPLQLGMTEQTMAQFRAKELTLTPGARGQSDTHREASTPLTLLMSVTGIVLLIACLNAANLLLARAADRSVEMAVRLSLGGGRRQLLGQLLTESLVLAVLAGGLSLLVARWTLSMMVSFLPPDTGGSGAITIDGPALLFAAAVSLGTGLLFGLVPALHSTRPELLTVIKSSTVRVAGTRRAARFRNGLVTAQMGLSMALLATAGLFIRSLTNASRVDLGLEPEHVVTFRIAPVLNGYVPGRSRTLFARVGEALASLPGVTDVAAARVPVLSGQNWATNVRVEGFRHQPDADENANYSQVGPGYLRTLGMQLLAGRAFTPADDAGGPLVAMVTESFARKFGLGRDAVGKRMSRGGNELDIEIVGLVKDAKYSDVKGTTPPVFFMPYRQDTTIGSMNFYVRSRGEPGPLLRSIPAAVAALDPNLPVADLITLPDQVRQSLRTDRMIGTLSAGFAALATLLAAIGLYAVLAYSVSQRTREIGVRMALGADTSRVRGLVMRQVGRMALVGGIVGLAGAIGIGRAARSLLFEVQGFDPLALGGGALVLAVVAAAAGYLPARRASRVHPMEALRSE